MLLQFTLERPSDLAVLEQISSLIDVVEVGSSLLKKQGVGAIADASAVMPPRPVIAGMKIIDNGGLEARTAFEAGAQMVSVLPSAPRRTHAAVQAAALEFDRWVVIDASSGSDNNTAGAVPFPDRYRWVAVASDHPLLSQPRSRSSQGLVVRVQNAADELDRIISRLPDVLAINRDNLPGQDALGETQWIRQKLVEPGLGWTLEPK